VGVQIDAAQVHCEYLSLKDYIRFAYNVKDYQIVGGPDWLGSQRYDIAAKIPAGAPRDQIREMMQSLLSSRFGLQLHRGSKEFPVYALTVAKTGLKLKETAPDAESDGESGKPAVNVTATGGRGGTSVNLGNGSYFTFADNKFEARKLTMTSLAETLARFMDRPVVDQTELKGNYDLKLELAPEDYRAMLIRSALVAGVQLPPEALRALDGVSDASLFAGLQAVGLKLEARKAPLEVLIIDHALQTPTEN
jgi:uncharacterized protein (TIGR03435 family)